jgi:hypothetical protein
MTGKQYRAAIEKLGMNPVQAAEFLQISLRSSRYYAARGAPHVVAMLLRLMLAHGISIHDVGWIMKRKFKESKPNGYTDTATD